MWVVFFSGRFARFVFLIYQVQFKLIAKWRKITLCSYEKAAQKKRKTQFKTGEDLGISKILK